MSVGAALAPSRLSTGRKSLARSARGGGAGSRRRATMSFDPSERTKMVGSWVGSLASNSTCTGFTVRVSSARISEMVISVRSFSRSSSVSVLSDSTTASRNIRAGCIPSARRGSGGENTTAWGTDPKLRSEREAGAAGGGASRSSTATSLGLNSRAAVGPGAAHEVQHREAAVAGLGDAVEAAGQREPPDRPGGVGGDRRSASASSGFVPRLRRHPLRQHQQLRVLGRAAGPGQRGHRALAHRHPAGPAGWRPRDRSRRRWPAGAVDVGDGAAQRDRRHRAGGALG